MRAAVISFTARGDAVNKRVGGILGDSKYIQNGKGFLPKDWSLDEWTRTAFNECELIIFIGAAAIAVRAIAPYIKNKAEDPAVIVIDEAARFVIPLLSGHIGGANRYAERLAQCLGAQAVITTATDINKVFAVDVWAVNNGYHIVNRSEIKTISSALLEGRTVGIESDFDIIGALPEGIETGAEHECGICISDTEKKPFAHTLNLIPKRLVIGAGSRKDADPDALWELFLSLGQDARAVGETATIDIKKDERAILRLSEMLGVKLKLYTAEELCSVPGDFTASEFVKHITGVDNVCERAAAASGGHIIIHKTKGRGVTIAIARKDWSVRF